MIDYLSTWMSFLHDAVLLAVRRVRLINQLSRLLILTYALVNPQNYCNLCN